MPVRRHIQDEESPRVRESTNLSSLSMNNPSLASQLSLRQRKQRRAKTVVGARTYAASPTLYMLIITL